MHRRSLRALAAALVLASALFVGPAAGPVPVAGVGPLPACRIDDILTAPRSYGDWEVTLVDWMLSAGKDYTPPNLMNVRDAGVGGNGGYVRKVAFDDLEALATAAAANGTPIDSQSAYRPYAQQRVVFKSYADSRGFDEAITFSARPGHSEHQLGLAIDFVTNDTTGLDHDWESTPTGAWMAEHAWEYGWLMSYPDGKQDLVCYSYEPWHYRYVGREMAAKIHESGLTIREYLWANHTQVDPACVALPAPPVKTPGKARSCSLPAGSESPAPSSGPSATGLGSQGPPETPPISPTPTSAPAVPASAGLEPAVAIGGFMAFALLAVGIVAWWQARRRRRYWRS